MADPSPANQGASDSPADAPKAPKKKRGPIRRLLGLALYVVYIGLILEVALQGLYFFTVGSFLFTRQAQPWYAYDDHCSYRLKPGLDTVHATQEFRCNVRTNAQGFRVPDAQGEYPLEKPDDTYRIILLGPSFAFGWGVEYEDSFAADLETMLEDDAIEGHTNVEIINGGVPSLAAIEQYDWFRNHGKSFSPNLVIQFVYGNTLIDTTPMSVNIDDRGFIAPKNVSTSRWVKSQIKKSAIVHYAWSTYTRYKASAAAGDADNQIIGGGRELENVAEFDPADPKVIGSLEYYNNLKRVVEENGARVLFVHFPLSYCIHHEDAVRWEHLGVKNIEGQIEFNRRFCDYLNEAGIECHNATGALQDAAEASEDRLYYLIDIHWTPLGNEVVARSVADHLLGAPAAAP